MLSDIWIAHSGEMAAIKMHSGCSAAIPPAHALTSPFLLALTTDRHSFSTRRSGTLLPTERRDLTDPCSRKASRIAACVLSVRFA